MAKGKKRPALAAAGETVHQPVSVESAPVPKPSEVYLQKGEAEVVRIDNDGNEIGQSFKTNIYTAETRYNNDKFKIKKKAQSLMSLKLTKTEVQSLLSKLGVQAAEIVDAKEDNEAAADIDKIIGDVDTARSTVYKAKYGDDLVKEHVSKAVGKLTGTLKTLIKREAGLKDADVENLEMEDIVKKAMETVKTSGSASAEEVRTEMKKAIGEWEEKFKKAVDDGKAKETELLTKFEDQEIDKIVFEKLSKAPVTKGDKVKIAMMVKQAIAGKHALVRKDKDLELRTMENKELPVLNGNTIKTFDDAMKEELESIGLWETDTRNERAEGGAGGGKDRQQQSFQSNRSQSQADKDFAAVEAQLAAL